MLILWLVVCATLKRAMERSSNVSNHLVTSHFIGLDVGARRFITMK